MKRRSLITLFIITTSLAVLYFFYLLPAIEEKRMLEEFSRRFFHADPAEIGMITIENGAGIHEIIRAHSGWRVNKRYLADEGAVERLLDVFTSARILKTVGGKEDMERFGVREPIVHILLNIAGRIETLAIAGENPARTGHYAYARDIEKIFLVNKDFVNELQVDLFDLRDKRLYSISPEEVGKVVIRRQENTVELVREEDGWRMISPLSQSGSAIDIEGMLSSLARLRAIGFIAWKEEFALLPRKTKLELHDRQSGAINMTDVYFWSSEGDKGVLVHRTGSDEAARVRRELWNLLQSEASLFLDRRAFGTTPEEVLSVVISSAEDRYVFTKEGDTWQYKHKAIPPTTFRRLLDAILSLTARSLVNEKLSPEKSELIIEVESGQGKERLEISDYVMDHVASATRQVLDERGEKVLEKVDYLYARSSRIDYAMVMNSLHVEDVKSLLEGMVHD